MSSYSKLDTVDITDDDTIQPDLHSAGQSVFHQVNTADTTHTQSTIKKTYEGGYFSVNYYRQYFDLNTSDFFTNCISSMNPVSNPPVEDFTKIGDLYGAVWITASLIFFLFFCNTFATLLSGWLLGVNLDNQNINYFKMIVSSINLLYGYTVVIPLVFFLILKFYFKVLNLPKISKLVSIYSYANLLWLPAVFLSIFRGLLVNHSILDNSLKWTCVFVGALLSGCSIVYKINIYLNSVFGQEDKKFVVILLGLLSLAHAGFSIGVKVCFFGKL